MPRFLVTGGRQRHARFLRPDEWHAYEKAVVVELDTETGRAEVVLEHQTALDRCPDEEPSFVFKAASWDGDKILLCTQTEVVVWDPRSRRIVRTLSHPWFNDVHHVARVRGRIHVVSTGLDAVLVLDEEAGVAEVHGVTGEDPWARFDRAVDYRKVPTTKPHKAHPNYVFEAAGGVWVSRFEQGDAVRIDAPSPPMPVGRRPLHDGLLHGGAVWFTGVEGWVVEVDPAALARVAEHDLRAIDGVEGRPLGWCRGIHRSGDLTLLGFSRLRPTLIKQNLAWLRKPLDRPEASPTRVCAYDLRARRLLSTWVMEEVGLNAVFSILPATPPDAGG